MGSDGEDSPTSRFEELKEQYEETGSFDEEPETTDESPTEEPDDTEETSETDTDSTATFEQLKAEYEDGGFESDANEATEDEQTVESGGSSDEVTEADSTSKFEQLKTEYEEGGFESEPDDTDTQSGGDDETTTPATEPQPQQRTGEKTADHTAPREDKQPSPTQNKTTTQTADTQPSRSATQTASDQTNRGSERSQQRQTARSTHESASANKTRGRPYVTQLPVGYWAEEAIIDWLGYLVEEVGSEQASEALAYYRSIGWIGERAEAQLREYLTLFEGQGGREKLTITHHLRSLEYIAYLDGTRLDSAEVTTGKTGGF